MNNQATEQPWKRVILERIEDCSLDMLSMNGEQLIEEIEDALDSRLSELEKLNQELVERAEKAEFINDQLGSGLKSALFERGILISLLQEVEKDIQDYIIQANKVDGVDFDVDAELYKIRQALQRHANLKMEG